MAIMRAISMRLARRRLIPHLDRHLAPFPVLDDRPLIANDPMHLMRKDRFLTRNFGGFPVNFSHSSSIRPYNDPRCLQWGRSHFSTGGGGEAAAEKTVGERRLDEMAKNSKESVDEKIADVKILRSLGKYLWLKDNLEFRMRVVMALGLLVGAKVINVQVPFLFKLAVDWLSAITGSNDMVASFTDANSILLSLFGSPAAVLVGYGIARTGASACNGIHHEN